MSVPRQYYIRVLEWMILASNLQNSDESLILFKMTADEDGGYPLTGIYRYHQDLLDQQICNYKFSFISHHTRKAKYTPIWLRWVILANLLHKLRRWANTQAVKSLAREACRGTFSFIYIPTSLKIHYATKKLRLIKILIFFYFHLFVFIKFGEPSAVVFKPNQFKGTKQNWLILAPGAGVAFLSYCRIRTTSKMCLSISTNIELIHFLIIKLSNRN